MRLARRAVPLREPPVEPDRGLVRRLPSSPSACPRSAFASHDSFRRQRSGEATRCRSPHRRWRSAFRCGRPVDQGSGRNWSSRSTRPAVVWADRPRWAIEDYNVRPRPEGRVAVSPRVNLMETCSEEVEGVHASGRASRARRHPPDARAIPNRVRRHKGSTHEQRSLHSTWLPRSGHLANRVPRPVGPRTAKNGRKRPLPARPADLS